MSKQYKTELHCHTAEASFCADEKGADTIEKFIAHGYDTVVITNHLQHYRVGENAEFATYEDYVDFVYDSVDLARDAARGRINVIAAFELNHISSRNDYLVFGLTREMTKAYNVTVGDLSDSFNYIRSCGGIVIQAHPFRHGMTVINARKLDGYEVYNTHNSTTVMDDAALTWAKGMDSLLRERAKDSGKDFSGLILIAGDDNHHGDDVPKTAILTDEPVTTEKELVSVLKRKSFTIYRKK